MSNELAACIVVLMYTASPKVLKFPKIVTSPRTSRLPPINALLFTVIVSTDGYAEVDAYAVPAAYP